MNNRIRELIKEATEVVHGHGAFGESERFYEVNHEKLVKLVARECAALCESIQARYHRSRKGAFDFNEKNIYAEGETAASLSAHQIKRQFGVDTAELPAEPEFSAPERIQELGVGA